MARSVTDPPWMTRLAQMEARCAEVVEQMNQPGTAAQGALMVRLAQEHGGLEKLLRPYREYGGVTRQLNDLLEIAGDLSGDAEFRKMAEAEIPELEQRREVLLRTLQEKLVTGDEARITSVICEVRAGTGGDEAALFAAELVNMITAYAARKGLRCELLSRSDSDLGGVREAILNVTGDEVYLGLRWEAGGHRVQRVPETEQQGRIHTSAATIAVLPEPDEVAVDIDWVNDVIEHVSAAGGPGGQNVNKVASAVKLEHKATGITVSMRDERSQHKNRERARRILISRVYDHLQQEQHRKLAAERKSMVGSGDRSERIRTYNFPQNRVTDHRCGIDVFDIPAVLERGELDAFHRALNDMDLKQRLEAL
ncbi:MAG: PCRF domain-containing protein [Planctomycetia bacterium]|nr:MAG: PCRF domain-containing protein [Planctomycetia bacterium]